MDIKEYIVGLTVDCTDQVQTEFDSFGVKITWISKILPHILAIETNLSKEELKQLALIKTVEDNNLGYYPAFMNSI